MKSIIQGKKECYICRKTRGLDDHHIFGGSRRGISERYGLKVWLCNAHHTGPDGAHNNKWLYDRLHRLGQVAFEKTHTREEFIKLFGKNYLEE